MQLGMIGLGRMGANKVRRLLVHDRSLEAVAALVKEGAVGASSLDDFVARLTTPRAVWLMIPAAGVDAALEEIGPKLQRGDILIDQRFTSRGEDEFAAKVLSAMRYKFGGHVERPTGG